jgi:hypothetical protein
MANTNFNVGLDLGLLIPQSTSMSGTGSKNSRRVLSPEAQQQLVYQALAADQGLAQLLSGQNLAGGNSSSSATLQAQDFMTKVISELAAVTSELQESQTSTQSQKKKASVICTELARQGKLPEELYSAGHAHFDQIHALTKLGYWSWATRVVPLMQRSDRLSRFLALIVLARYKMITGQGWNLLGASTIYLGQPICFLLGAILSFGDSYGRTQHGN